MLFFMTDTAYGVWEWPSLNSRFVVTVRKISLWETSISVLEKSELVFWQFVGGITFLLYKVETCFANISIIIRILAMLFLWDSNTYSMCLTRSWNTQWYIAYFKSISPHKFIINFKWFFCEHALRICSEIVQRLVIVFASQHWFRQ